MLLIANKMKEISFDRLMQVYQHSNRVAGMTIAPYEPEMRQIALAEQEFYQFLREDFFSQPGAMYVVWIVKDRYVSAARLEPYRDGFLLAGLETVPDQTGRGFAQQMLGELLLRISGPVYSHVSKTNAASLAVHRKCGFEIWSDAASFLDGNADNRTYVLRFKK